MPTKIIEVVVTGVVGPKPFPVRLFLVGLLIVSCVIGGLALAGNQAYQQSQNATATAIANANASATAISISEATQVSINATNVAYQPTANALAKVDQINARANMLKVTDVKLLTYDQVQPQGCGNLNPCDKVAFIQFTMINNTSQEAYVIVNGPCGKPGDIDPRYGPQAVFLDGKMPAGSSGTNLCALNGEPTAYMIEVHFDNGAYAHMDCWQIYPYTGKIATTEYCW